MELAGIVIIFSYTVFVLLLFFFWNRIKTHQVDPCMKQDTFLSVIIPVRNEEYNIINLLNDLELQDYPHHLFEAIVINDHSEDRTAELVRSFKGSFGITLLDLGKEATLSHKKKAIEYGIAHAKGTFIITTDGDCRVNKQWLSLFQNFYKKRNCQLIIGGVTFQNESSWFEKMQTVEFASLTGTGAASLEAGYPNMCNGANLGYEKKIFYEVGGFAGYEEVASGDDEFLMHKVFKKDPSSVAFLKNNATTVQTNARENWQSFYFQRKRWAGKWKHYQFQSIKGVAVFIFLANLSLLFFLPLTFLSIYSVKLYFLQIVLKIGVDFLFIRSVMKYYQKPISIVVFLNTAFLYPFYVTFFGLISNSGKYTWKGRTVS